ncbi:MAG: ATP-dependent Clp protease proteolytic subunit [Bacteroidia bacterium]|nr:ATP-dependent Clp protease proteolytic subunit [Bacteroidia bacterium]
MKEKFQISCEAQNNKAVIRIEGYISGWDNIAQRFKSSVDDLVSKGIVDLEIYINSQGGSVFEANEIANVLNKFTGNKIATLGALCASAATYIATKCDKIIAATNTQYMIHKPMAVVDGNADQIEARLKLLRNLQADYAAAYSKKTGLSVKEINDLWKEDFWMNAQEAKDKKFIDEVDGETTAALTPDQIQEIKALGYKHIPELTATANLNPQNNTIMKDLLITLLALSATSSEAQIVAQVDALKAKAAKAEELQKQLDTERAASKKAEIKAVLDAAENSKQITAAQRTYYEKQLAADFDATKAHIESLPKVVALSTVTNTGTGTTGEDRSKWTYADYQDKDPMALAKMADEDEAKFKALFKAHYGKEC